VHCQLIQMRTEDVMGFDMRQANRWRWRPDYEGINLNHMRCAALPALLMKQAFPISKSRG
jgi:hypothetical protein